MYNLFKKCIFSTYFALFMQSCIVFSDTIYKFLLPQSPRSVILTAFFIILPPLLFYLTKINASVMLTLTSGITVYSI